MQTRLYKCKIKKEKHFAGKKTPVPTQKHSPQEPLEVPYPLSYGQINNLLVALGDLVYEQQELPAAENPYDFITPATAITTCPICGISGRNFYCGCKKEGLP